MSWETRHGRGRYYTRSIRQGGRIVREYLGTGKWGEYWALVDEEARANRQIDRAMARSDQEALEELDQRMAVYACRVEREAHATLESAGYRRHQRGEWRRTRGQA